MSIRWDELRFFLAVARSGTIAGAARTLGVNESTVARHINELESDLEARLFERMSSGYTLTERGQRVMAIAERVEREISALELEVLGHDMELSGPIRVTVPEYLASFVIDEMAAFTRLHPDIVPELNISNAALDLGRRQSDIAIRVTRQPPKTLVGRRIAQYMIAAYATPEYLETHDLDKPETVGWLGIVSGDSAEPEWVTQVAPGARMVAAIDHLTPTVRAIRQGMGLGQLPCFLGDTDPHLVRLGTVIPTDYFIWILTHESLKSTRRVRAFMDHMAQALSAQKALFEGQAPIAGAQK